MPLPRRLFLVMSDGDKDNFTNNTIEPLHDRFLKFAAIKAFIKHKYRHQIANCDTIGAALNSGDIFRRTK